MNRGAWVGCRLVASAMALRLAAFAVGVVLMVPVSHADSAARAARLSIVQGQVQIAMGGQLLANPALMNTPLFEGAEVMTAGDGQAELQFDDGGIARLAPDSSLRLAVLRGQGASSNTEIVLTGGLGYFELPDAAKPIRVRFGDSVVTPKGLTVLRINMDNPPGTLAVFSGNVHLERAGGALAVDLEGGDSITLTGPDPSQYILTGSIEPDSWDAWNSDRDQELAAEAAMQTNAPNSLPESGNPTWDDLNAHGDWHNVPGQGYVWSPYEAANPDWDPYGNGSWEWTQNYDYIWVSSDSWGYLPYQCGVWNNYSGSGWGWSPGQCTPWWTGGLWASNVGYAPVGYHRPRRPHPGQPHRGSSHPGKLHSGNLHSGEPRQHASQPMQGESQAPLHPVIPVNRRLPGDTASTPARNADLTAAIAGQRVQTMRSLAPRPQFDGSPQFDGATVGFANRSRPVYSGTPMSGVQRPASGFVYGNDRPSNAFPTIGLGGRVRSPAYGGSGFGRGAPAGGSYSKGGSFAGHPYSGGGLSSGRSYSGGGRH